MQTIVEVNCDDLVTHSLTVTDEPVIMPGIWDEKYHQCDAAHAGPYTALEVAAVKKAGKDAGYTSTSDVSTLYELCAENWEGDYYVQPDTELEAIGIREVEAMLMICPEHPQAMALRNTLSRSVKVRDLDAAGKRLYEGTYLVGKEVTAGVFVAKGNIENCYWERTDRRGRAIQNDFVIAAKRLEISIQHDDYSVTNQGCGTLTMVE